MHIKRAEAVRLLLEHTADPRANGALCLWLASKSLEHSAVLPLLLLGRQFPPEAIDNALSHACAQSNVLACSTLLPLSSRAMEWNIMDGVRAAVDHGTLDILNLLAAYKKNKEDGTAPQHMAYGLGLAARIAHVPSASFLLKEGALLYSSLIPSFQVDWFPPLLARSTSTQRLEMVELLRQYGARLSMEKIRGSEQWSFEPI